MCCTLECHKPSFYRQNLALKNLPWRTLMGLLMDGVILALEVAHFRRFIPPKTPQKLVKFGAAGSRGKLKFPSVKTLIICQIVGVTGESHTDSCRKADAKYMQSKARGILTAHDRYQGERAFGINIATCVCTIHSL